LIEFKKICYAKKEAEHEARPKSNREDEVGKTQCLSIFNMTHKVWQQIRQEEERRKLCIPAMSLRHSYRANLFELWHLSEKFYVL